MSMIGNYLLVEETTINEIKSGKIDISKLLYETEHNDGDYLDIDKSWHTIHYMLCGHEYEGEPPFFNVVLGGTIINDDDVGYGPARHLTPIEIKEAFDAIKDISEEEFRSRFDCNKFEDEDIYPQFDSDEDFEYVWSYFEEVKKFFEQAVINKKHMLLYIN